MPPHKGPADEFWSWFEHSTPLLQENGCLTTEHVPEPTLDNPIHPMFDRSRWVTGYEQPTLEIYNRMMPSLGLASLMLTEPCMLAWFNHYTCGTWTSEFHRGEQREYIKPHRDEHSRAGRKLVQDRLKELSGVIGFMFVPKQYAERPHPELGDFIQYAWGITWDWNTKMPWRNRFHAGDWPVIVPRYRKPEYAHKFPFAPIISLRDDFEKAIGYKSPQF